MKTKEKSTLTVILAIVFLSLFIVLPPVFRSFFPKEEVKEPELEKLVVLICNRKVPLEKYTVTTNTVYAGGSFSKATITYKPLLSTPDATEENVSPVGGDYSALEEIEAFKLVEGVSVVEGAESTIVTLNEKNANSTAEIVTKKMLDIDLQRSTYEGLGFTCDTMES